MVVKRIARVFVHKTQYTPVDELCFFGVPGLLVPEVDEVHVSCIFSWDKPRAEQLAEQWEGVAPVKLGGPAYSIEKGDGGGDFVPGRYLREGYVITSRGCPKKCPFCLVPCREGGIRELPVVYPGSWVMDNNLLACSRAHVEAVFSMLMLRREVKFLGGLDIQLLRGWHVEWLSRLRLSNVSIAFDNPNEESRLVTSLELLHSGDVGYGVIRCFVLGGFFRWDSPEKAEERCRFVLKHGATPCAMYYRGPNDVKFCKPPEWAAWANRWTCQPGVYAMAKREGIPTYQDRGKV